MELEEVEERTWDQEGSMLGPMNAKSDIDWFCESAGSEGGVGRP